MKVLDLREKNGWWKFLFTGDGDFEANLLRFKRAVPLSGRRWDDKHHCWMVPQGEYDERLKGLFENWDTCVALIRAQGKLW